MKKYIVFLGLFSFLNTGIKAQGFNTLFFIDTCNTVVVSMKILNNYIYVGGYMADYTKYSNGIQSFVTKYNLNGNKISQVKLRDNKYWRWWFQTNFDVNSKNELIFSCTVQDTSISSHNSLLVLKIDTNLNLISTLKIDTSINYDYFLSSNLVIDKNNGNIYITGHIEDLSQLIYHPQTFLIKVDSSFKHTKVSFLNNYNMNYSGNEIIVKRDTVIVLSVADNAQFASDPDCKIYYQTVFMECDTNCILINKNNSNDSNYASHSFIHLGNNYYSGGSVITKRHCGSQNNVSASIFKWSQNFKMQWQQLYGDSVYGVSYRKVHKVINENNFIVVGENKVGSTLLDANWNGMIVKYDENGNRIWGKEYRGYTDVTRQTIGNYDESNTIFDFEFLPDGSIIACGNVEMNEPDSISQQGWLLRLRPDGCLNDNDCGVNGIENKPNLGQESKKQLIEIYPNPTTDIVTINIDGNTEYPLKMNIFDIVGNKVKSILLTKNAEIISCKDLPQGSYIAVFSQQQKVIGVSKFVKLK